VQAIKRIKGMRLIGPVWSKQPVKSTAGVPATNRINNKRINSKINEHIKQGISDYTESKHTEHHG
jgi:hypothetical protein